jgi:hypothetical protein
VLIETRVVASRGALTPAMIDAGVRGDAMTEIGVECPQCGKRLENATCSCGWRASGPGASARCRECGTGSAVTLDEDGEVRCAVCHVTYLQRRAALDPIAADELEECRASIRASLDAIERRSRGE